MPSPCQGDNKTPEMRQYMGQDSTISSDTHAQCESLSLSTPTPEVADLIAAYLEQTGIEYVFGIPGDTVDPLYDALTRSRHRGGPKTIIACHQAGAAFMADGYARETGKLGVCFASSGPGATNLITGIACAHENGVPLLVLTGHPPLAASEKHAMQEASHTGIDTLSMFRHCTRYNTLVSHPRQVETKLAGALHKALQGPGGPVHLSFPVDILRSRIASAIPSYDLAGFLRPSPVVDKDALDLLLNAIREAKNLVLLIGGWCEEAIEPILQFAVLRGAAFVTTQEGKALVNPRHPLFRGVAGHGGHASADAVLQDPSVDLVLAVGFRMSERTGSGSSMSSLNSRLVHIDESEERLYRTPMASLHVRGHIRTIFQTLVERLGDGADAGRMASMPQSAATAEFGPLPADPEPAATDTVSITPQDFMRELGRRLPPATRYLADAGNSLTWALHFLQPGERRVADRRLWRSARQGTVDRRGKGRGLLGGGRLRIAMDFAPVGYAIGAAVGTAAGNPTVPVACITGGDGMRMNGQEISVAVEERLTIVYLVLNEVDSESSRMADTALAGSNRRRSPATDFAAFARSLGADAFTVRTARDLQAVDFDAICRRSGPTLLDIHINPDAACSHRGCGTEMEAAISGAVEP